jgi:two-component system sensor histidine kinase UhpB
MQNTHWRIALGYAAIAGAWIILSDRALGALLPEVKSLERWSMLKGLGFVAVTSLGLWFYTRASIRALLERERRREQAEARAVAALDQLRALTARIVSVREEEKRRIARDLHDELGQLLTALELDVGRLERKLESFAPSAAVNELIDDAVAASALAAEVQRSVQRIASDLRPGALDALGLAAALREELRRFAERTGAETSFEAPEPLPMLARDLTTALYRIVQEALTNVARHGRARSVRLTLACDEQDILLRVVDDGVGMSDGAQESPHALGLLGMRERAMMVGGEAMIARGPTGGTIVEVRAPLWVNRGVGEAPGMEAGESDDVPHRG